VQASAVAEAVIAVPAPMASATSQSAGVAFEGVLFKQRDVFKGWRPRYFTLQVIAALLNYLFVHC
jgi:hypothetical protein